MAVTIESLTARANKLKELADKADKEYRKKDLNKQYKRVSRRLAVLNKKAAEIAAAKAKAEEAKAAAKAAAEKEASSDE